MRAIPAVRLPRVAAVARRSAVVPASARRFSAPAAEPAPAAAPPEAPAAPPKAKPRRRFGVFRGTLALVALTAGAYYATEWYEAGGHTAPDPLAALASDAIRDARRRLEELRDAALAATGQDVRASQAADASTAAEPVAREAPVAPATSTSPQKEAPKPAPAVSPSAPTKEEPKKEAVKETVTEAKPAKTADVSKVPSKDVVPKEAPKESAKSASTPAPAPAVAASAPSSPPNLAPAAPATQPAATAAAASPSPSFLQKQLDLFSDLPALAALTLQVEALKDALKTADMPRQEIVAALEKLSSKVDELERNEMEFVKEALDDQAESFAAVLEQGSVAKEQALEEQREKLAAEARERLAELEVRLKEAEEAAAAYARLSETVKQSVEALKEEAEQNAKELATYFETVAKDTVERERGERVAVLRDLAVRLELLEKHRMDNIESAKKVAGLQKLHGAVNALAVALREHAGRPFTAELSVLKKLAADNPIVDTCVDMIGNLAAEGVPSDFELERWFVQGVKGAALRAGRMEGDGGIASYVLAGIAAYAPFVIGGARTPTDEVIERAEKHLRDGDVEGAAREVNQLQGWAKVAAKDWLEAARGKVKANYVLDLLQAELMVILSEIG